MKPKSSQYGYDVFLSHSAKDREFVSRLASDLDSSGVSVWVDQRNIRPGDSFAEAIEKAMKNSRFLLIVMSPAYFQSAWAQQEWHYALASEVEEGGIRLIPLLYQECDIPAMLRTKQWVDFRDPTQYQVVLDRLVKDLLSRPESQESTARRDAKAPIPGERVEELDPKNLSELKEVLRDAVQAFRARPEAVPVPATVSQAHPLKENGCFIIISFSVESLNIVYEDFIRPVLVDRCHLQPERGDDVFGSNVVMDDIAESIRRANLIIADLTGRNANVFYEVGIAHALNKQVLLMTQSIEDVPFDLRHRRALVYEYSPRGCKKLEKDLFDNVQNMLQHPSKA